MSIWSSRATMQTTVLAATREGRGGEQRPVAVAQRPWAGGRSAGGKRLLRGASLRREPSQYRHIASGSPPRPASRSASVAHVPIYEIGSGEGPCYPDRPIRVRLTSRGAERRLGTCGRDGRDHHPREEKNATQKLSEGGGRRCCGDWYRRHTQGAALAGVCPGEHGAHPALERLRSGRG